MLMLQMATKSSEPSLKIQHLDLEHPDVGTGNLIIGTQAHRLPNETISEGTVANLKTTPDGRYILIPQPPDDPENALNVNRRPSQSCHGTNNAVVDLEEKTYYSRGLG